VRFGGCNLRCPGWGYGELPDGTTVRGCDTVFAVYPQWKDSWEKVTPNELIQRIRSEAEPHRHLCITGGEPLMQPRKEINAVMEHLVFRNYSVDLFTNGSRSLEPYPWHQHPNVTVVMDFKLPGSGEFGSFNFDNLQWLQEKDAVKFVVKDRHDFETAVDLLNADHFGKLLRSQIFFGPVWGALELEQLAEWISREVPFARLNIQTHKIIWDPEARRT